jgi:hypothetical protein
MTIFIKNYKSMILKASRQGKSKDCQEIINMMLARYITTLAV